MPVRGLYVDVIRQHGKIVLGLGRLSSVRPIAGKPLRATCLPLAKFSKTLTGCRRTVGELPTDTFTVVVRDIDTATTFYWIRVDEFTTITCST